MNKIFFCIRRFQGMTGQSFTFKQFQVHQEKSGMKVGTDGVLLGAWANGGKQILDIGTGTGLIALFMAQRFANAKIDGIDIDADTCLQAQENIAASPFKERIVIKNISLQNYTFPALEEPATKTSHYDAIVSNPPFFVNSLHNPDHKRNVARHADFLPFRDLLRGVKELLSADGEFSVIIPTEELDSFLSESCMSGLFEYRRCCVKTTPRKAAKRVLLSFRKSSSGSPEQETHTLLNADGSRSEWYRNLTKDFYLT